MSWWQWLLVSIGLYFAAGVLVAGIDAYAEGVVDSRESNPDACHFSDEPGSLIVFWFLYVALEWIPKMRKVFKVIYMRGKTRANRKLMKQGRKAQDKAFKELCKQNGWDYKKVKSAQVYDS